MGLGNLALASVLSVSMASLSHASGNVWTVDDDQPANFTTIQAAIDAANDGDAIVVAAGSYAGFTVTDKDLRILGRTAPSTPFVNGASKVQSLAAGKSVVLASLKLRTTTSGAPALSIVNSSGNVSVQHCELRSDVTSTSYTAALRITNSSRTAIADCTSSAGQSGHGAELGASSVALWSSPCTGGAAATQTNWSGGPTDHGGDGLHGDGGFFFASGSALVGGHGGDFSISALQCSSSSNFQELGRGGHGCSFEGTLVSTCWFSKPALTAGATGNSNCSYSFDEWPPAQPFKRGPFGSTARRVSGGAVRAMTLASLLQATNVAAASFRGAPFDVVEVVVSPLPDFLWSTANSGVWGVSQGAALPPQAVGVLDASGNLAANVALPALAAGVEAETWFVQPLFTDASGARRLGTPYAVTLTH